MMQWRSNLCIANLFLSLLLAMQQRYAASINLPVLPISTALPNTWTPSGSAVCGGTNAYCGDVRAVVNLTSSDIEKDAATVQIFWRRRDPRPFNKSVIVVDATHKEVSVLMTTIEQDCGLITVSRPGLQPGIYYFYYLPYRQSGGGAGLAFSWQGCADQSPDESNVCVQARRQRRLSLMNISFDDIHQQSSVCLAATPQAAPVLGIENRDGFHAFSIMEQMATENETATAALILENTSSPPVFAGVFVEPHNLSVRVFDNSTGGRVLVRWADKIISNARENKDNFDWALRQEFTINGAPGEWVAFQLGMWAYHGNVINVNTQISEFAGAKSGSIISSSAINVVNLGGVDAFGVPFSNDAYNLEKGLMGSLWCGFAVPLDAKPDTFTGNITISSAAVTDGEASPIVVQLNVVVAGAPVPDGGAGNLESMARLQWLDSTLGLEDTVPLPFIPVQSISSPLPTRQKSKIDSIQSIETNEALTLTTLGKVVTIGMNGLPISIKNTHDRVRNNKSNPVVYELLASPIEFFLLSANGAHANVSIQVGAHITTRRQSSISWTAKWLVEATATQHFMVNVVGQLDFSNYLNFNVSITNPGTIDASLDDVQLSVPVAPKLSRWIVGFDNNAKEGSIYEDRQWRWTNTTGSNKVWLGATEAGVVVNLKGNGLEWDSPMFGKDFPVIPEIPKSWGGEAAESPNKFGANVTNGTVLAFSGPRTLAAGASVDFLFDLALTPSKPINWTKHWATRTRQLGYDVPFASAQDVASMGVSVVTLHQGTGGIVNGSLINPWINYPFLNDTVPLLTNYTEQANALGMAVKMYYTIRELSARAVEMFAFKAMQGEILVDQDPYDIVQPGYAHGWNNHGGAAYLHQHMVSDYGACWQQRETNGDIDPSMCSRGVSRLFNYYVAGLQWSFNQPPYMNGIYYDGTNFPRIGMIRIRRTADTAAQSAGKGFAPLLDLHTGRDPSPPACSYASHYPLMDYIWNGEGFNFNGAPAYWVTEISNHIHGITGDLLGSGAKSIFRAMTFARVRYAFKYDDCVYPELTTKPYRVIDSREIWKFWDDTRIAETDAFFGWWQLDEAQAVKVNNSHITGDDSNCSWEITRGSYFGSNNEDCGLTKGPTVGCWNFDESLEVVKAACCRDPQCTGFSYGVDQGPYAGEGCCKADLSGPIKNKDYDGYRKPPSPCNDVYASTWSKYGSHAVVSVATWCPNPVNISLTVDWDALGLDSLTATATLPGISGVQNPASLPDGLSGPFTILPDKGLLLFVTDPTFS